MAMPSPLPARCGVGATRLHLPAQGPWPTISAYMIDRFPHLQPETLISRFDEGGVVNAAGQPVDRDAPLGAEEFVWYYRDPPVEKTIPFDVEILYEDDNLLVVDKPHFLPTTPSGRYLQNTALVRLRNQLGNDDLAPIHRLDRQTAGIVLFSTRPQTRGAYQQMFARRRVEKEYRALAHLPAQWDPNRPRLGGQEFPVTVLSHIHKERGVLRVREIPGRPPNSETTIELLGFDHEKLHLSLRPRTGQMHQLRVHLASLDSGIVNDPFYPTLLDEAPDDFTRPMQLLARRIRFTDPLTKQPRDFTTRRTLTV